MPDSVFNCRCVVTPLRGFSFLPLRSIVPPEQLSGGAEILADAQAKLNNIIAISGVNSDVVERCCYEVVRNYPESPLYALDWAYRKLVYNEMTLLQVMDLSRLLYA